MREFMEALARQAGQMALDGQSSLKQSGGVMSKNTPKDIVTVMDRRVETLIVGALRKQFPDHNIFGEEYGFGNQSDSPFCWVIDPIDGTAAYERGQLYYSISIGLQKNGRSVAGVVFAPRLNELFFAEEGRGAFLNGSPIHVSDRSDIAQCCGVTGFACLRANLPKNNLGAFNALVPEFREIRRYGSSAIDLCYVACGRIDAEWEYPLKPYDIAAGTIILREAGGRITDFDGGDQFPQKGTLGSNGLIHESVRRIILEHDYR